MTGAPSLFCDRTVYRSGNRHETRGAFVTKRTQSLQAAMTLRARIRAQRQFHGTGFGQHLVGRLYISPLEVS